MSFLKPLEALLRPPVEWFTSISAWLIALMWLSFPTLFLFSPQESFFFSLGLIGWGLFRFHQGYRVYRYQKRLKKMPSYTMTLKEVPVSKQKLFLGKGFLWTAQHTQRLRDLDLNYNLTYRQSKSSTDVGGEACIHGVSDKEDDIAIHLSERASHLLVLGLPGVGKTRFAELVISQDIRRGDVVIVLDPKGDADLLRRMYCEAKIAGREKDFMVFHLGFPAVSCRYNPIGNFTRVTEVANRISNQLPGSGESAAFKEFGWQFVNSIAIALVAMGEKPDYQKMRFYITKMDLLLERYLDYWLPTIDNKYNQWVDKYINDKLSAKKSIARFKALIEYVEEHQLKQNPIFDDLYYACRYDQQYYSKITASLGPLLKKLTTGKSAELLSPNESDTEDLRPILDWLEVIRCKKIVYVGLDALSDPVVASAVGNSMFSDLVSVAGRLYKFGLNEGSKEPLPRVCLHSDEFNEIIGDEFIPLLNKARGAGFTVTAYTQTWSDVEARLKSSAKAGQVAGNIGTTVMFRCKEAATVEMFLNQLPKVPILRVLPASGSQDAPFGTDGIYYQSTNEDRLSHSEQRLIEQNDVMNLPKGQAFCLLEGGKLYKLRMPLPQRLDVTIPTDIEILISKIRDFKKSYEVNHVNEKSKSF
jgi:conjugative coupling factor TraD (SXT/TOL subfamily)